MERKDYQDHINSLLDAVQTLLDANNAMGEKLDKTIAAYEDLKAALDFFQEFFKKITEGRADDELIAQEVLS